MSEINELTQFIPNKSSIQLQGLFIKKDSTANERNQRINPVPPK